MIFQRLNSYYKLGWIVPRLPLPGQRANGWRNITYAVLAIVLFGVGGISAGSPVQIWTAADLHSDSARLAPAAEAKGIEGTTLGQFGAQSAAIWRRTKSGEAELHRIKTDLLVIEEGEATLVFGGTIVKPRTTEANEVRGASIAGGESRKLAPGDVVRVPPGTPHQFILARGQSVSYFALKIPR